MQILLDINPGGQREWLRSKPEVVMVLHLDHGIHAVERSRASGFPVPARGELEISPIPVMRSGRVAAVAIQRPVGNQPGPSALLRGAAQG
jgi:hypothetical protein